MTRYVISWGPPAFRRPQRTVRLPRWLAAFVGRHLWRVLGKYHSVQIEEGVFATSAIPTADRPATRAADVMSFEYTEGPIRVLKYASGEQSMEFMRAATMSPRVERQMALGGDGPNGSLLMETTRTNLCLWSQP